MIPLDVAVVLSTPGLMAKDFGGEMEAWLKSIRAADVVYIVVYA